MHPVSSSKGMPRNRKPDQRFDRVKQEQGQSDSNRQGGEGS
jgi:hypothetical protein